jgi:hypothetical protein
MDQIKEDQVRNCGAGQTGRAERNSVALIIKENFSKAAKNQGGFFPARTLPPC